MSTTPTSMTETSSLLEFTKAQQNQRVQAFIMSKSTSAKKSPTEADAAKSVSPSSSNPPAVIKIYPVNVKKVCLQKNNTATESPMVTHFKTDDASFDRALREALTPKEKSKTTVDSSKRDNDKDSSEVPNKSTPVKNKCTQGGQKSINILKRTLPDTSTSSSSKVAKSHSMECCPCCRDTLDTILRQQEEILRLLKKKPIPKEPIGLTVEKLDLLPNMPFEDINDFLDFDESLTNENVQYQFMVKLNRLLVNTEHKSVSNIMSAIMTNELSKNISWIGVKNTVTFSTSNMVGMIVDLVQDHNQASIDIVRNRIAEWLRRAGDRINNELRRKQKKLEQGYTV